MQTSLGNNENLVLEIQNAKKQTIENENGNENNIENENENENENEKNETKWHLLSLNEVLEKLNVNLIDKYVNIENPRISYGLTADELKRRFERYGFNEMTPMKEKSPIIQYLLKYTDPLMVALNIAGVLSMIVWALAPAVLLNLYLALVLFVIVILSSTFAYIQEGRSRAVMAQFIKLMPSNCRALREGKEVILKARDLVVGDIVHIQVGDSVPGDMRLFWINELKIETSALTGESVPVTSTLESKETRMVEATNIAWSSCSVMDGEGYGVIFATGDQSMIGRIHELTDRVLSVDSTLQKEIRRFVYILAIFSFTQSIIFFVIAMARHKSILTSLVLCFIVIMVANVPQGLPSTVISLLVIIGKRLAENNVNVKRLQNVETLGSCTVIASDKTGTITQNKMTVSQIWIDGNVATADSVKSDTLSNTMITSISSQVAMVAKKLSSFNILGDYKQRKSNDLINVGSIEENAPRSFESEANIVTVHTLANLQLIATLCNRAHFEDEKILTDDEASYIYSVSKHYAKQRATQITKMKFLEILAKDSKRTIIGDASDKAIFRFVSSCQSIELLRYQYKILFELPFSSKNKFALSVIQPHGSQNKYLLIKGAPEIVLTRCNRYHFKSTVKDIDNDFTESFNSAYRLFANSGERVLGFAMVELTNKNYNNNNNNIQLVDLPTSDYEFVGLMSMIDPPKPKVKYAVEECQHAGVKVIMVTGDHPLTAKAIATEVGILTQPTKEDILTEMKNENNDENNDLDDTLINAIVVTGKELDTFTEEDWTRVLNKQEIVFARTSPEHKLKIVEHLQSMGHVVAVTGDGVNDAPALKKADIGVAMGISGSDVARGAGDIVIMDDDFSSIVLGVKEGRVLFDNLKKASGYTLTHLWPEVVPVLINIAFDIPLAMNSLNVLTIDCGTELAPAISLAYEQPEGDVMKHPPRDSKKDRLASWKLLSYAYGQAGVIETLTAFLGFLMVFKHHDVPLSNLPFSAAYWTATSNDYVLSNGKVLTATEQVLILSQAQAIYWFLVVVCQVCHVFLIRTRTQPILKHGLFRNMVSNYGVMVELCLIIIFIFVPGVNGVLQYNYHIPIGIWLIFLVGWVALIILNEGVKYIIRNKKSQFVEKYMGF